MSKTSAKIAAGVLAFALVLFVSSAAGAAGFMNVGDIKGEAASFGSKESDILSSSWGAHGPPTSARAGAGSLTEITVVKVQDSSSPSLQQASNQGKPFTKIDIILRKAGGTPEEYISYQFKDALVTSYSIAPMVVEGERAMVETVKIQSRDVSYRPVRRTPKPKPQGRQ